jgi:hypothetical protein
MRFRSGCGAGGSASCASKRLRRRSCRRRESSAAEPLMQTYPVERAQDISDALWSTSPYGRVMASANMRMVFQSFGIIFRIN